MAGAACSEWHLHPGTLARPHGKDYRPADPDIAAPRMGEPDAAPALEGAVRPSAVPRPAATDAGP